MNTTQKPPLGSENSSKLEQSLMDTLMSEASQKSNQTTSVVTPNAISSLASEAGASPCNSPDGLQIAPCGPEAAPASHSQQQEKGLEQQTSGISGPSSLNSSASAALSMSLGSRLQARLGTGGLMEYRQTWKQKVTPAGRPYWAHTALAHRTSGRDCIGWPTPNARDWKGQPSQKWGDQASLPRTAGWTTPDARVMNDGSKVTVPLPTFVKLAHGLTTASPLVETEKPAASQLNPHFSRWLMGFPPEWCDCAVMAMQSFPSVRKSSSKRS